MNKIKHYSILVEIDRCIGCYTCEVACKQENNLEEGFSWIKVVDVGPEEIKSELRRDFVPTLCLHCGNPSCMEACPEKAIRKDNNGIVLIEEALCTGCKLCLTSCPISTLQFSTKKGIVEKCTLCLHLVNRGLEPACVKACPTEALYFGEINDVINRIKEKRIRSIFSLNSRVVYTALKNHQR